ncbi:hypothetical protein QN277_011945 [Acacia crassicarpa]|uniref:Uncharacterized protein n=1 Tax=Acacia crassicarpa TaxID=499986 RepID=A0AAE1N0G7_9FABA|nr:hypothetical protein QN277_011945 [Acacia crassicarpa]
MKKGLSLIFAVWMILLVYHADLGRSASGNVNGSLTSTACSGSANCIILDDDVAELQMNSHAVRMLFDIKNSVTGNSGNPNGPGVNCPPKTTYTSCVGPPGGSGTAQPCGVYTRGSGC